MKLLFRLLLLPLIAHGTNIFAQRTFTPGIIGGFCAAQIHGDNSWGFNKLGPVGGVFVKKQLNPSWHLRLEMIYIQKGARKNPVPAKGDYTEFFHRLNYIEMPLSLRWQLTEKYNLEIGAAIAGLIHEKSKVVLPGPLGFTGNFERRDVSVLLGVGYQISKNIEVNIRFTNSIIPISYYTPGTYVLYGNSFVNIFNNIFDKGYYNNVLSFTLVYEFQ